MTIERLGKRHDTGRFDCGVASLNDFLARYARQNDRRGITRTYVTTQDEGTAIAGYVTIRVGQVACADLPLDEQRRLPRYPVPVLHVARLAVDKRARGSRLGERLLLHALAKALEIADEAGLWAVEVVAKDESARRFYERYGFTQLVDDALHLYLPVKTVRRAFSS